jgi:hypothetical protein
MIFVFLSLAHLDPTNLMPTSWCSRCTGVPFSFLMTFSISVFYVRHSGKCETLCLHVLICLSLMIRDSKHFFMYLFINLFYVCFCVSLHSKDKFCFIVINYPLNMWLNSISQYLVEEFCMVFIKDISLSGFSKRVMLPL